MIIPEQLLDKWKQKREHGDNKQISESGGVSVNQVTKAFQKGRCSAKTMEVISAFYKKKEERIQEILKENDIA